MKKIALLLTLTLLVISTYGQEKDNELRTIFGNKNGRIDHGGYAALSFGYTRINGNDAFLFGLKGGWLINHHVTIGLAGYGFTDDIYFDKDESDWYSFAGGYGSLLIEPIIGPRAPVHVTFPVQLGVGGLGYYEPWDRNWEWEWEDEYNDHLVDSDAFLVVEPGIEVEFNVVKFFRVGICGSYRWTSRIDIEDNYGKDFDKNILHGFAGNFSLKFGKF